MNRQSLLGRLSVAVIAAMLLLASAGWACNSSPPPAGDETPAEGSTDPPAHLSATAEPSDDPELVWCTVRYVVDGDTIDVEDCEDEGRVRLILVDAPESTALCFSDQATRFLADILSEGSEVGLEPDVSDLDQYGRKLRYLWNSEGMINEMLVRAGHAWLAVFPPDVKHRQLISDAQDEAREAGRGVWGECSAPPLAVDGECDPGYPTVCIPSPPPNLDCRELPYRKFTALPPDPHELDGDKDGIACEGP